MVSCLCRGKIGALIIFDRVLRGVECACWVSEKMPMIALACGYLSVGLEVLGRVSSDFAVMMKAMKVLYAVAFGWRRLGRVLVFRRRFRFTF